MIYKIGLWVVSILYYFYNPIRAWFVRRKNVIRVVFVIDNISKWKYEALYKKMLIHPRFRVLLLVRTSHFEVSKVLIEKGYAFEKISYKDNIRKLFHPDITFYEEPYGVGITKNLFSLFGWLNYGFAIENGFVFANPYCNICWRIFVMNEDEQKIAKETLLLNGKNCRKTGLPIVDDYLDRLSVKNKEGERKNKKLFGHLTILFLEGKLGGRILHF